MGLERVQLAVHGMCLCRHSVAVLRAVFGRTCCVLQFDGTVGARFLLACAEYCRNQAFALDALKRHRRKDQRLNGFLAVSMAAVALYSFSLSLTRFCYWYVAVDCCRPTAVSRCVFSILSGVSWVGNLLQGLGGMKMCVFWGVVNLTVNMGLFVSPFLRTVLCVTRFLRVGVLSRMLYVGAFSPW